MVEGIMGEGRIKVGASAGKKINLGNYESYNINLWEEKEVNEKEESGAEREKLFNKLRDEISTWEKIVRGMGEQSEDKGIEKIVLTDKHIECLNRGESLVFPDKRIEIKM